MVICSRCGLQSSDDLEFCPNCGNDLKFNSQPGDDLQAVPKCEKCGSPLEEDVAFCSSCGAKLTMKSPVEDNFCQNCGEKLDDDAEFCHECGKSRDSFENSKSANVLDHIYFTKVIIFALISSVAVAVLSIIFLAIMNFSFDLYNVPYFPLAFYLAIFLSVGFFSSLQKNYLEGVLLALISGILTAILEGFLVSSVISSYGYGLYFGYHSLEFILFSIVIGFMSNYLLKDFMSKYIKIEALF